MQTQIILAGGGDLSPLGISQDQNRITTAMHLQAARERRSPAGSPGSLPDLGRLGRPPASIFVFLFFCNLAEVTSHAWLSTPKSERHNSASFPPHWSGRPGQAYPKTTTCVRTPGWRGYKSAWAGGGGSLCARACSVLVCLALLPPRRSCSRYPRVPWGGLCGVGLGGMTHIYRLEFLMSP